MWFIGDDVDGSCAAVGGNDAVASLCEQDNGNGNAWGDSTSAPLPCAISEITLGSVTFDSSSSLRQQLAHSSSSTISLSRLKNERRPMSRDIVRGMFVGSTISFVFIATLLVFMPDSTTRWMQCMHHRIATKAHSHSLPYSSFFHKNNVDNKNKTAKKKHAYAARAPFQQTNGPHIYQRYPTAAGVSSPDTISNQLPDTRLGRNLKVSRDDSDKDGVRTRRKEELSSPEQTLKHPQLVIAGSMSVEGKDCQLAQLNLQTGIWSLRQRIQLSLYNSYSGGKVYSLLANHTVFTNSNAKQFSAADLNTNSVERPHVTDKSFGSDLVVVGAYDTTYRNSQTTYCSVGKWDGVDLSKIGEGLCNSALSKGMKITSAAISGPNDLYVGGSFQTQVWNGNKHEFVKIFNIAHYNAINQVWLPLPVGQITCSWCTVTILALAYDTERRQLHIAGKFNAIDGNNIPAGLALYDQDSGHLTAHPGGGLTMKNVTEDGVGTAAQFDQENGVLYVMGTFERLTATKEKCVGIAAYEIDTGVWTCLADPAHSVLPSVGGNMLLTPYGLLVAGKTVNGTTSWPDSSRPYTVAVLKATIKKKKRVVVESTEMHDDSSGDNELANTTSKSRKLIETESEAHQGFVNGTHLKEAGHEFVWSWLPGFDGHDEEIHTLSNGFGDYVGTVFIGGVNFVSKWSYKTVQVKCNTTETKSTPSKARVSGSTSCTQKTFVPVTVNLANNSVHGSVMAISQLDPPPQVLQPQIKEENNKATTRPSIIGYTIIIYCVTLGAVIGMFFALMCNKSISETLLSFFFNRDAQTKGISLDTLTYGHMQNTNVAEAYHRAMSKRFVKQPHLLDLIDPQEIILHRIIGEGTFGRVWSAKWGSSSVAVKEFVFAQAAVAGKSRQQQAIVEEIIGEAGMMAILRHPNVLQLFGCSLTAQAIWIVSELCSLGSLRQLLDDRERKPSLEARLNLALQVAEGMAYLHAQDPPIIHRDLKSHNIFVHETFAEVEMKDKSNDSKLLRWPSSAKKKTDKNKTNGSSSDSASGGSSIPKTISVKSKAGSTPSTAKTKSSMSAKIGDWGSARATLAGSRTMTHGVGTACWMAPEVLKQARYTKGSDVYGFGIVLWELATRREVYEGLESTQIIAMVANDHLRPEVPMGCPWNDVMVKCWAELPSERPTFEEIVKELNHLCPRVKKSTYTGEDFQPPNWKFNSYQKGGLPVPEKKAMGKTA